MGIHTDNEDEDEDEDSQPAGLCPNHLAWLTRCFSLWNGGIVFQKCQKTRQVRVEKADWELEAPINQQLDLSEQAPRPPQLLASAPEATKSHP